MSNENLPVPRTADGRARQAAWQAYHNANDRVATSGAREARNKFIATIGATGVEQLMMPGHVDQERIDEFAAMQAGYSHDLVDLEPPQGDK